MTADQPPVSSLDEEADDKLFEYVLTNPEHSLNELFQIVDMNSHTVCALGGMISRLVVDHIPYLTAISVWQRFKDSC